jgi:uncharacterized protein (UPF0276 family)
MELKTGKSIQWGIGLRPHLFPHLHNVRTPPLLEVMSDNLMAHSGGPALHHTDLLAARAKIILHGVGLNIAGFSKLDFDYLNDLRSLVTRYSPKIISDHLCFTQGRGIASYELLPAARSDATLRHVCERIDRVQAFLNQQICLENVSAYVAYKDDIYSEGEFFSEMTKRTGCGVLLDTNNLYINSVNFGFNAWEELVRFPLNAVQQLHVAGHTQEPGYLFDTHDQPVCSNVLELTRMAVSLIPRHELPIVLEWDDGIILYDDLMNELSKVQARVPKDNSMEFSRQHSTRHQQNPAQTLYV